MSAVKDRELITVFRLCPESLVLRKLIRDMRTGEYILFTNTAIELITLSFQSLNLVLLNNIWPSKAINCYERNHTHLHLQFTCHLDYYAFDK